MIERLVLGWEVAGVAPRQRFEAEIEDLVQFVEGDAHVESGFGGGKAGTAGLLHDRQGVGVEPARLRRRLRRGEPVRRGIRRGKAASDDGGDGGGVFFGFKAGAQRSDTVFDEVEARAGHDVVFGVVGGGEDFFGDTEGRADFGAGEFAVFQVLEIGAGKRRFYYLCAIPQK